MTDEVAAAPPPEPEPKPNPFARMVGVFFSPGETFASIARRPDWVVPLVIILIISLASSIVIAQKVDFGAVVRQQMEQRKDLSQQDIDRAVRIGGGFAKAFVYFAPLFTLIIFLIAE